jgi:hypothetical protein
MLATLAVGTLSMVGNMMEKDLMSVVLAFMGAKVFRKDIDCRKEDRDANLYRESINDPICDVYLEETSSDNENETQDVAERDTHIISPRLEMEASGQLQDVAVSFVATLNSMEASVITENQMNQGLQADHIHV